MILTRGRIADKVIIKKRGASSYLYKLDVRDLGKVLGVIYLYKVKDCSECKNGVFSGANGYVNGAYERITKKSFVSKVYNILREL